MTLRCRSAPTSGFSAPTGGSTRLTGGACRSLAVSHWSGLAGRLPHCSGSWFVSERSVAVAVVLAAVGGLFGASSHGWAGAVLGALAGFAAALVVGVLLGWLDWPLRLVIAPGMVATFAGQASADGRAAHRYLVPG